jgi:CHAT domain-containing protein
MKDGVPRHPEAQTMAAFIEGTLSRGEVAAVAEHLRGCGDCRTVVSETARFEREEQPETGRNWWLAAAAIVAAILVALPFVVRVVRRDTSPIAGLIAAAPHEHRSVEARLSGFPWARLQAPSRGEAKPDPADLKLAGAAGAVLDATAGRRDSASGHAKGVAYVVIGRNNDGIVALERAASGSKDPKTWNDLAAARYAAATTDEHPSQLPEALADVDHALRLDPRFAEARFNRALILERLGVLDQARKAWEAYLDLDNSSEWSVEARAHLHALSATSRRFDPKMLETTDAASLVREFPEEARRWGEAVLLPQWAQANDEKRPAILAHARAIGDALASSKGEHLLADAISAIDRSTEGSRAALIDAYRIYYDAKLDYSKRNAGIAEPKFRRAAKLFREGGSPMADVSSYYAASATFDQHRPNARTELERLLGSIDGERHRALAAQIEWELAVAANTDGDWGAAAREADRAVSTLRALGERRSAAFVEGTSAIAYEMMGERDLAWSRRTRTYAELSTIGAWSQLHSMVHNATVTLSLLDETAAASALIDLLVDDIADDPYLLSEVLGMRARQALRANNMEVARLSIKDARDAASHVADAALREMAEAQIDLADAALETRTAPRAAIAALDRCVSIFSNGRLTPLLPQAHLELGRARRRLGEESAALADYASAMLEIEKQQSTVGDAESRLSFLDTAAQIVDETVDLQLTRGAVADAFMTADRARSLTERDVPATFGTAAPAKDVAILEYVVRPHALTLFCVSQGVISANTVAVERHDLALDIDTLADRIRRRASIDEIHGDSAAIYQILIAPVRPRLAGAAEIVLVPDRQLFAVPFAALWDEGEKKYLLEEYVVRIAPGSRRGPAWGESISPALVMADPAASQEPRLLASREEASHIAALYGAVLLSGEAATRERFVKLAPSSALIHFAGHANSDATQSYGALRFAAVGSDLGVMASSEIAHLSLSRHPLVILAACGTFRGDASHVAGMSSLARSFLVAGARGVVGTLWEIDDDFSAPLFTHFHQLLRAGASPARSLRDAQLEALHSRDARTAHPATWAPLELLSSL